jgi:PAS domain S-box-containing protein
MVESISKSSTGILTDLTSKAAMKVLHVDDDLNFLKVAGQCLKMQGRFQVDTARSVEEAMEKMEKETYDAIISDFQMPGKDGLELLKELREEGNGIPFVIFTGKGREEVVIKALSLGADGYFNKHGEPETVYGELAHGIRQAVERKKADMKIWEREERLRAIFGSSPDAITVSDLHGNILDCNEAAWKMLGFSSKEEVIGKSSFDFIAKKDRQKALENLKKTSEQGTVRNLEYTLLNKDGAESWGELSVSILKDSLGNPLGFVGIMRDITARKKAEKTLSKAMRESNAFRKSGIEVVGSFPWGTHLCQFYKTKDDLLETLVPYFSEGLRNNEYCMWVTSEPLGVEEAKEAMRKAVPDFDRCLERGQIEILPHTEWYLKGGVFNSKRVLDGWINRLNEALAKGYDGLRLTGNTLWLEKKNWNDFANYEKAVNSVIGEYKMIAICTYFLDKCQASEVIDVVSNHQFALIRKSGEWKIIESSSLKHAREEARKSDEILRDVFACSPDAITVIDLNGNIVECNQKTLDMLGYSTRDELIGRNSFALVSEKDRERAKGNLTKVLDHGSMKQIEYIALTKDGTEFSAELSASVVKDSSGNLMGFVGITKDITERKKAEEALRGSEEKWRSLAENAPNIIVIVDRVGTIEFINRTVVNARPEEIVGKSVYDFIDPEHHNMVKKTIEQVFQTGEGSRYEISGVGPKGSVAWYATHVGPIKRNGQVASVTLITTDFTERKEGEHVLLESQQKFERLFKGIPEATAFVDVNDCILDLNPRFRQLFGYSVDEARGKPLDDLIVPNDKKREAKMLTENNKEGYVLFETVRKTKDGSLVPVSISAAPISVEGQHVGDVVLYQDIAGRKQTEEALRRSEEKFRNLFDRANDAMMYLDRYGRILDVNGRTVEMFGGTREELVGKHFAKIGIFSIKETPMLMRNFADVLAGKKANLNASIKNKKGQEITLECSVSLVKTDEFTGIVVVARDTSERQKAEEELRNSEERLSVLFELAPDAYYLNDLKGNFIDGNKAAEELTGYTKNVLIGRSFLKLKLLPRSQALKAAKLLAMNALGKPTGPDEFVLNRKDGTQVPVEIRTYPVRIKGKTVVLGIARDISIRKKDEQAVKESQQKFEGLFRHNPEATVYLDSDFRILDANPRFYQLFGYSAKKVEGKNINEVVAPEDMMEEAERLDKDAKKGYANRDTVRRRKDGSLVRVSISAAPVTIEDKPLGYVGVYKDITNLKDAEEHLRETNERLEVTNEKLHVVGGLTRHDVRNKLSAVTGNAYLLRRKLVGDAKALGQLNEMEAAIRLVEEIFEFARIYEKLGVEQPTSMDVGKAVDGAVSLFSDLKGVKMVNECRGLTVLADSLLSQLFYNLIDNSLKYGEKIRQIRVYHKKPSADQLEIVYEDDGVGIPDNMRGNLFKEGFTSGKGTGYGLFMIKRMCGVYGWTIQETGIQGKGARFILTVPEKSQQGKPLYKLP